MENWAAGVSALAADSGQGTACVDADDALHRALAQAPGHADHVVVQVDRGVAVSRDQPEVLADGRHVLPGPRGSQEAITKWLRKSQFCASANSFAALYGEGEEYHDGILPQGDGP